VWVRAEGGRAASYALPGRARTRRTWARRCGGRRWPRAAKRQKRRPPRQLEPCLGHKQECERKSGGRGRRQPVTRRAGDCAGEHMKDGAGPVSRRVAAASLAAYGPAATSAPKPEPCRRPGRSFGSACVMYEPRAPRRALSRRRRGEPDLRAASVEGWRAREHNSNATRKLSASPAPSPAGGHGRRRRRAHSVTIARWRGPVLVWHGELHGPCQRAHRVVVSGSCAGFPKLAVASGPGTRTAGTCRTG